MKRTALFEEHVKCNGKIVDFHGWEMPLHYVTGIVREHLAVRSSVGIFDVSHMGDLIIHDKDNKNGFQSLLTNDIINVPIGKCVYTHLTDEQGKIIDDLIVTKTSENGDFFCVPNASMIDIVRDWIVGKSRTIVTDVSSKMSCLAIQGPRSKELIESVMGIDLNEVNKFEAKPFDFDKNLFVDYEKLNKSNLEKGVGIISGTGYTGENGFEIIMPNKYAPNLFNKLLNYKINSEILPIGLGARDTLRLEMGYLLSGQDFNKDRTPIETNCSWVLKFNHEFIGRVAIEKIKESRSYQKMIGIKLEGKAPARAGSTVHLLDSPHETVGSVSSGNFSPSLGVGIALAYMNKGHAVPDMKVVLKSHGREFKGVTKKTPFILKK
jgi:aminomethyltransferase